MVGSHSKPGIKNAVEAVYFWPFVVAMALRHNNGGNLNVVYKSLILVSVCSKSMDISFLHCSLIFELQCVYVIGVLGLL